MNYYNLKRGNVVQVCSWKMIYLGKDVNVVLYKIVSNKISNKN